MLTNDAHVSYEETLALYYSLRPGAIDAYNNYILSRTPAGMHEHMDGILAPNAPKLMISDGQNVTVKDKTGAEVPGNPARAVATDQYAGFIELQTP